MVARHVDGTVREIATVGGPFVDPRTRHMLNERAITVWLDAPVNVHAERTAIPGPCCAPATDPRPWLASPCSGTRYTPKRIFAS
jgi:shikimate kinase